MPKQKTVTKKGRARIQHHRHTGKVIAHRHTHYPALFFLLLLVGVFLAYFQFAVVQADDLNVTAKVSADIPTVPATIDEPPPGTTVTESPITISGTCQIMSPAVVVVIYRGADILGSTTCQPDGTYSIDVPLIPGVNNLIARTFNITQDAGPDSTPVTVTYDPPGPPPDPTAPGEEAPAGESPSGGTTGQGGGTGEPCLRKDLFIRNEGAFLVFGPDKPAEWVGAVEKGCPPYTITIDWGDGKIETFDNKGTQELTFTHVYTKMKTHFISITASDAAGNSLTQHLVAVTPARTISPLASPIHPQNGPDGTTFAQVYAAYAAVVIIGAIAFYQASALQTGWLAGHHLTSLQKFKFPKIWRT